MRIFFDTEFSDEGDRVQLVSLGAVREDGRTFYAENAAVEWSAADPWVVRNILPLLSGPAVPPGQLRAEFADFAAGVTEFWAWYGTYDWFVMCRLYGGFQQLPRGWPKFFHDLETLRLLKSAGRDALPPQPQNRHHALFDALWVRDAHAMLWVRNFVGTL